MPTTEPTINTWLEAWLNKVGAWEAKAQDTGQVMRHAAHAPDIILRQGLRMPVVIESEFDLPAVADAKQRLGIGLTDDGRPITEVVALGYKGDLRDEDRDGFMARLDRNEAMFTVQLISQNADGADVWPQRPLPATPWDLVAFCEYAQVPQTVVDHHGQRVAEAVRAAGSRLLASIRDTANPEATLAKLCELTGSEREPRDNEVPARRGNKTNVRRSRRRAPSGWWPSTCRTTWRNTARH